MNLSRNAPIMWQVCFYHLLADQHDVTMMTLAIIQRLIITVFKAVQAADLNMTAGTSPQPATLPRHRCIQQLQASSITLLFTYRKCDLITPLSIPPVPKSG